MTQPTTLADLFTLADPDHAAVILPEEGLVTTYHHLAEQIEAQAAALQQSGLLSTGNNRISCLAGFRLAEHYS